MRYAKRYRFGLGTGNCPIIRSISLFFTVDFQFKRNLFYIPKTVRWGSEVNSEIGCKNTTIKYKHEEEYI